MQDDRNIPFALIVEDHPLVADSLFACLRECNAELDLGTAESLGAALRILAQRPAPVLIVTDLSLTDARGTEAVSRLREAAPASPLLVFTALDDPALRSAAMKLGTAAYLIKTSSIQTLREAVEEFVGARPANRRFVAPDTGKVDRLLTPKQRAVLDQLVVGRSNKEIAARLNISDETVGSHMKAILGRLGVRNRTEAVVRYLQMIKRSDDRSRR